MGARELITYYEDPTLRDLLKIAAARHPAGNLSAMMRFLGREELKRQGLLDSRGRPVERQKIEVKPKGSSEPGKATVPPQRPKSNITPNEDPTTEIIEPVGFSEDDNELGDL